MNKLLISILIVGAVVLLAFSMYAENKSIQNPPQTEINSEEKNLPSGNIGGLKNEFKKDFDSIDTNSDGTISLIEWRGKEETFHALDSDGDGTLSKPEYREIGYRVKF